MKRPQHVELWGLPGAGKSTTARALSERGVNVATLLPLRKAVAAQPIVAACVLARLAARLPLRVPLLVADGPSRRLTVMAIRQAATLANHRHEPALLDEGVIHEAWRALYNRPELIGRQWWRAFLGFGGPVVAFLDVTLERAARGIEAKQTAGRINRELAAEPMGGPRWFRAKAATEAILAELSTEPATVLLRLDIGCMEPAEVQQRVSDLLAADAEARNPQEP